MENVKKLEQEVVELKKKLELIEDKLKQANAEIKKTNMRWKPEIEDLYFCIKDDGEIRSYKWENHIYDKNLYSFGNIFETKEDAEFAFEKLKVISELKEFARPYVFEDEGLNYTIYYNDYDEVVEVGQTLTRYATLYFSSEGVAKTAIRLIGEDRIKRYYLEVEC